MTLTYAGTIVELGGEELGRTGKPKPRKVVIKSDPAAQYGKTFRVWQDSEAWQQLSTRNGQWVTVLYETEEREGPNGPFVQNKIVGIDAPNGSEGVGAPPQGSGPDPAEKTPAPSDWGQLPQDAWTRPVTDPPLAAVQARMTNKTKDDYWNARELKDEERNRRMAVAWAIGQAIALGHKEPEAIHTFAHQLLVLQDRIVSELNG